MCRGEYFIATAIILNILKCNKWFTIFSSFFVFFFRFSFFYFFVWNRHTEGIWKGERVEHLYAHNYKHITPECVEVNSSSQLLYILNTVQPCLSASSSSAVRFIRGMIWLHTFGLLMRLCTNLHTRVDTYDRNESSWRPVFSFLYIIDWRSFFAGVIHTLCTYFLIWIRCVWQEEKKMEQKLKPLQKLASY